MEVFTSLPYEPIHTDRDVGSIPLHIRTHVTVDRSQPRGCFHRFEDHR